MTELRLRTGYTENTDLGIERRLLHYGLGITEKRTQVQNADRTKCELLTSVRVFNWPVVANIT